MSAPIRSILLLSAVACQRAPQLDEVKPGHAVVGDVVAIRGTHLPDTFALSLVREGADPVPLSAMGRLPDVISVVIPSTTPPGLWSVRLQNEDTALTLADSLRVDEVSALTVCESAVVTNTRVSLVRNEARIERFSDAGGPEIETIRLSDVAHVELDEPDASAPCSVIWLRLTDGHRVAFDQSRSVPMRPRAERLATELGTSMRHLQSGQAPTAADAE